MDRVEYPHTNDISMQAYPHVAGSASAQFDCASDSGPELFLLAGLLYTT